MKKRKLHIVVLSDIHLGSRGCHADELLVYLNSIEPKTLVLNGGIIGEPALSTKHISTAHLKLLKKMNVMASNGTEIYFIDSGNNTEALLNTALPMNHIKCCENLVLDLDGKKIGFFHGAILDHPFFKLNWFHKFGKYAFTLLRYSNKLTYWISRKSTVPKFHLSKTVIHKKQDTDYTERFKSMVSAIAHTNHYDTVVCGNLHQPEKTIIERPNGNILYLNSGDWTAHLSTLEYSLKRWKIYRYANDKLAPFFMDAELKEMDMNTLVKTITSKKERAMKGAH